MNTQRPALTIRNLFRVVRPVGGGFLGTLAGVDESPVVFVPTNTTGFCSGDTERGLPEQAAGAKFIRVRALKGQPDTRGRLDLVRTDKGWRVNGWGGVRVSAVAQGATDEALAANADALVVMNTPEQLASVGLHRLAARRAEQDAAAAAKVSAREKEEAQRKMIVATAKAAGVFTHFYREEEITQWLTAIGCTWQSTEEEIAAAQAAAKEQAELAALAAEIAALEAAEAKAAEEQAAAAAIGVSLEVFRTMTDKQRRLAAHKARLAAH